MFTTTRDLACTLPTGGSCAYTFILPKGSPAVWVEGYSGLTGGAFAAADSRQVAQLTGNGHDAQYHYVTIPANAVASDDAKERATIAKAIAKEAALVGRAGDDSHPRPYIHAFAVTTKSGRCFLWVGYAGTDDNARALASGEVFERLQLEDGREWPAEREKEEIWDLASWACGDDLRARGVGLWDLTGGETMDGLKSWRVQDDDAAPFHTVRREFGPAVWAHEEESALAGMAATIAYGGRK